MGAEVHLWQVGSNEQLSEIGRARLDLESRLQEWLAQDVSILDPTLLVIGREVETDFGGFIDILCIDAEGDLVIVELKRDRTPREVTAQALDYASWVEGLSHEKVTAAADDHLAGDFEAAFRTKFGIELPETLNGAHRILVVGSEIDPSSERIMRYLSDTHGVNINAATFHYFQPPDGAELLARVFVLEPSEVERKTRTRGSSKRRPTLSYEELSALAVDFGVSETYEYAVTALGAVLHKQRRRTSIALAGSFDGKKNVVITLLPASSSAKKGLRYWLHHNRFAELARIPSSDVERLMPQCREHRDEPGESGSSDYIHGFIKSLEEIDRLAGALSRVADPELTGP